MVDRKIFLIIIVLAIIVLFLISIIKRIAKSTRKTKYLSEPPKNGPYIVATYFQDGGIFEDGKCGWLDIECEDGSEQTVVLNFNKKSPTPIYIPLNIAKYRVTYRDKSKASMMASGVLKTINESNGGMGAFANAVYDAGVGSGQLSSVVIDVDSDFIMKLGCTTDGLKKKCKVIS